MNIHRQSYINICISGPAKNAERDNDVTRLYFLVPTATLFIRIYNLYLEYFEQALNFVSMVNR